MKSSGYSSPKARPLGHARALALEDVEQPVVLGHHAVVGAEVQRPLGQRQRVVGAVLGAVGHELRDALGHVLLVEPAPDLGPVVVRAEVLQDEAPHGLELGEVGHGAPYFSGLLGWMKAL